MRRFIPVSLLICSWFVACGDNTEQPTAEYLHEMDSLRIEMLIKSTQMRIKSRKLESLLDERFSWPLCADSAELRSLATSLRSFEARTASLSAFMDSIGNDLDLMGEYDSLIFGYRHAADPNLANVYWLGENHVDMEDEGKGKSREMALRLNGYAEWCRNEIHQSNLSISRRDSFVSELGDIARSPADLPKCPPKFRDWSFESYNFYNKPLIAEMAYFEILNYDLMRHRYVMLFFFREEHQRICFPVQPLESI